MASEAQLVELHSLVEYEGSSFVERCKRIYRMVSSSGQAPAFRHFHIKFLSENLFFHIIAEDVTLLGPIGVTPLTE